MSDIEVNEEWSDSPAEKPVTERIWVGLKYM